MKKKNRIKKDFPTPAPSPKRVMKRAINPKNDKNKPTLLSILIWWM